MKHTFRTLLGLVLVVFVLAGCSNPAGPEIPEGAKVEFRWCTYLNNNYVNYNSFLITFPRYLSSLRENGKDNWVYDIPKGYDLDSYRELTEDKERLKKFSDDTFEKDFGTKYYKKGTTINLTKWTRPAKDLVTTGRSAQLYFLAEDVESYGGDINSKKSFDTIEVGNVNIVVYIYWRYI